MEILFKNISKENPVIAWWSGGIASAVACYIALMLFGKENVRIVFIDTRNEDEDTYRFLADCEAWYGKTIERITNEDYDSIKDVWLKFLSLNVAYGAICSTELKRAVRIRFQRCNAYSYQTQGFDISEPKRALAMSLNYPDSRPIFPLLLVGYTKKDCINTLRKSGIKIPKSYQLGFRNNNCLKTGCVQGGIGYWQKMRRDFPDKFFEMAKIEHILTNIKGEPVTICKDQGKNKGLVFLLPHPDYPNVKDISMMKGREPEPLIECNGYCGLSDLDSIKTT